jgi:hypothetical protein
MANDVFNQARGSVGFLMADTLPTTSIAGGLNPANSRMVTIVWEVIEADDTLNNHDDVAGMEAAANTEATATNYSRNEIDDLGITVTVNNTANDMQAEKDADVTWTSVTGNAFVKLTTNYDADNAVGTDANILPMTYHDFAVTPNGGDITADYDQTNGFWRST